MSRTSKTEGVVLRSMRYGESDRILHIYTPHMGQVSAIAKGVRKVGSKFGGRLELYFRTQLVLYKGKGDMYTVTQAQTLGSYQHLRADRHALAAAASAGEAVYRLLGQGESNQAAYNLLCRFLTQIDQLAREGPAKEWQPLAVAFRVKLMLAAGFAPSVDHCALCGSTENLSLFSGNDGGVVCSDCASEGFPVTQEMLNFIALALSSPLAEVGALGPKAANLTDRAVKETLLNHAHVRLDSVFSA